MDSIPLKRCSKKNECLHPEQVDGDWLPETTDYFMLHKADYCHAIVGNLCITHPKCNMNKHTKTPAEYMGRLL